MTKLANNLNSNCLCLQLWFPYKIDLWFVLRNFCLILYRFKGNIIRISLFEFSNWRCLSRGNEICTQIQMHTQTQHTIRAKKIPWRWNHYHQFLNWYKWKLKRTKVIGKMKNFCIDVSIFRTKKAAKNKSEKSSTHCYVRTCKSISECKISMSTIL